MFGLHGERVRGRMENNLKIASGFKLIMAEIERHILLRLLRLRNGKFDLVPVVRAKDAIIPKLMLIQARHVSEGQIKLYIQRELHGESTALLKGRDE